MKDVRIHRAVNEIDYSMLPTHCRDGMKRYVEEGILPGNFLQMVIQNDLVHAFANADDVNTLLMKQYAVFLMNEAPIGCWGSEEKMLKWEEDGGLQGVLASFEGQ